MTKSHRQHWVSQTLKLCVRVFIVPGGRSLSTWLTKYFILFEMLQNARRAVNLLNIICDVWIYLPGSRHLSPSVWFPPSFPHLSLSSLAFISLNCLLTSLLFIYLHISSLFQSTPLHLYIYSSIFFTPFICISTYFFFISPLFHHFSIVLNLCTYLSYSICHPSTHSLF